MPTDIHNVKWACWTCISGHRATGCRHFERVLFKVRAPGRPAQQAGPDGCKCNRQSILMTQIWENGKAYCIPTHHVKAGGILEPYRSVDNIMNLRNPAVSTVPDVAEKSTTPAQLNQTALSTPQVEQVARPPAKRRKRSAEGEFEAIQQHPEQSAGPLRRKPGRTSAPVPGPSAAPQQWTFINSTPSSPPQPDTPAATSMNAPVAPMGSPPVFNDAPLTSTQGMPATPQLPFLPAAPPYLSPSSDSTRAPDGCQELDPSLQPLGGPTWEQLAQNTFEKMQCGDGPGLCHCGPSCACPDCVTHNHASAMSHRNSMSGPLQGFAPALPQGMTTVDLEFYGGHYVEEAPSFQVQDPAHTGSFNFDPALTAQDMGM